MSAPAAPLPHANGDMSESQAIERLLAKSQAGLTPEPRTPEELLEERDPAPEADESTADEPAEVEAETRVEGDELSEELGAPKAAATDPLVKFDDGSEMPLSEVKRGFLRMQDYTRKTQDLASLRKTVESERAQFIAEKKAVSERLGPLIEQVVAQINSVDARELAELEQVDPGKAALRRIEIQTKREQAQRLAWEQQQLREQAAREEQQRIAAERQQVIKASRSALMEKIPAAKKDFDGWYKALGEYVLSQGVSPEKWDDEVDHSVITLAWKAKQYDDAARKAPATKEQLRKAPQPMRPGAAKPPGYAQARAIREATEQAAKSGSIDDAIRVQMLKQQAARR